MAKTKSKHGKNDHKGIIVLIVVILIVAILAVGGWVFRTELSSVCSKAYDTIIGTEESTIPTTTTTVPKTEPTTVPKISDTLIKAEDYVDNMTLNEKVCQLFVVTPEQLTGVEVATQAGDTTKAQLKKYPVGGIVYYSQNKESDSQFEEMIKNTKSFSKTPLFIMKDGKKSTFTYRDELQVSDNLSNSKNIKKDVLNAFAEDNQILLMPNDLETAVKTITNAVKDGTITEDDLDVAVTEIINVKYNHNLMK